MTHEEPLEEGPPAIAVVGMAGRFPGAPDLDTFWQNLAAGVESATRFGRDELLAAGFSPKVVDDPQWVPVRGTLEDAAAFDAGLFGMSPSEATLTDPQHRVFLETCWAALENAGYDPGRFEGDIALFAGCAPNTYQLFHALTGGGSVESLADLATVVANDKDHLTTRVSYKLNLRGPSVDVQTACSTSLVAVQLAVQSLLNFQCDLALCGGVSIAVPMAGGHRYQPGAISSKDGHCRAFDAQATGIFSGDGAGVVVLRRLEDALEDGDTIRAVILGAAINNDGSRKVGYTAPSIDGQAAVIRSALALAEVDARSISYVEAHGTGTALGDPVEVSALSRAFREDTADTGFCALGSVKTNVGHLNTAAGVAGLIKTISSLEAGMLPPSLHFETPNPRMELGRSPFYVNAVLRPWPRAGEPRRAGVSAFGAGGTNAHVIVEEAPLREEREPSAGPHVLRLSARTDAALEAATDRLARHLRQRPQLDLADVAFTLREGRRPLRRRRVCVAASALEAADRLERRDPDGCATGHVPRGDRRVAMLFCGQGFQRAQMGRSVHAVEPVFRREVDRCAELLRPLLGLDIRTLVYPAEGDRERAQRQLDDQLYAGPALFCVSWASAQLWLHRGLRPDAVLGQSTGEYMAAAVAGVLDLEDALSLFVARAKLMATAPPGALLHVALAEAEVRARLVPDTWVALCNGPRATVVSGRPEAIEALRACLEAEGVSWRRVRVSVPAHCPLLEPIAEALAAQARKVVLRPPRIPLVSGVTGAVLTRAEALDPDHWVRHLLEPVRFGRALAELASGRALVLVEAGPHRCVSGLTALTVPDCPVIPTLPPVDSPAGQGPDPAAAFLRLHAAGAWALGLELDLGEDQPGGRRIPLPSYPFERQRFWWEPRPAGAGGPRPTPTTIAASPLTDALRRAPRPELDTPLVAPRTEVERELAEICAEVLGVDRVGVEDEFFALGADSLVTLRVLGRVEERLGVELPPAAAFDGLTVARLAPYLEQALHSGNGSRPLSAPPSPPCVVPFRRTGARPPLFFVHPAAGIVFPYFELARQLGPDQPFYGVQAHGIDGRSRPDQTVVEMAARYVDAIRSIQPEGPYYLGAFSFGCYPAYEMALQLEQRFGEKTALLALIDESAPLEGHRPGWAMMSRVFLGRAGKTFFHHLHDYLYLLARGNGEAGGLMGRLVRTRGRGAVGSFLQRSAMAALIPEESHSLALHQAAMRPLFALLKVHLRETLDYVPVAPVSAPITLFKSDWTDDRPFWVRDDPDPTLGWRHLTRAGVRIERIEGDHLSTIRKPHVVGLARRIAGAMD